MVTVCLAITYIYTSSHATIVFNFTMRINLNIGNDHFVNEMYGHLYYVNLYLLLVV